MGRREWDMVVRSVAIALIVIGASMLLYNGYQWWDQIRVAVHDPKLAMSIADNWDDRSKQSPLKKGVDTDWQPKIGEEIGQLIIPRIGAILPIIEGTDEDELAKGVGHYVGWGTVLPGETGHAVLSGHRDTVFRRAGELKDGDRLYVKMKDGNVYTYQIRKRWITHAEDRTVIVPKKEPILTLTTCYPFDYVGNAPDRYIIQSELIEVRTPETDQRVE